MKEIKKEIWILADDRVGTFSQSFGLADEIGLPQKLIKLDYNLFAKLPNFLFSCSLISLKNKKEIQESPYLPSLVISAGRRSAPIALFIKKLSQDKTKIIQIMDPNLSFSKFDFVILPKHDMVKDAPNLIKTIGSLTKVNEKKILVEKEKFKELQNAKKTIALMLGGSSKKTEFSAQSAKDLGKTISQIAENMDAKLLILSSRRTSPEIAAALKAQLDCDFTFFEWEKVKDKNPYLAILGFADFFVISGDSVSMISECCSSGKPVYIFDEKEISSKKHRRFHENLIEENYAKKFSPNLEILENFTSKKLEETKRVADIIRKKF
jgi:mitochondrial fission protein ELM1